ncbi:MAG: hypothetical protein P8O09_04110 [Flavobacteriaceae bacterium]|nr:hypothetical protein [Flavobacteriaceae bacterium]
MKKTNLIAASICVFVLSSCAINIGNSSKKQQATSPSPKVVQQGAGFFLPDPSEKYVIGTDKSTNLWKKYIDAHNNRDFESLMLMESDSIQIVGPTGNRISGKDQHKEALSAWIDAEDPKWKIYWAMPYKGVSNKEEWIIAGHELTRTVDGKVVKQNHMIDAKMSKDGKVELFYVYSMDVPN